MQEMQQKNLYERWNCECAKYCNATADHYPIIYNYYH